VTALELQSMRLPNQGWDDGGNAPASVAGAWQRSVACAVTDAPHDQQPAAPLAQAPLALLAQAGMAPPQDEAGDVPWIPAPLAKGSDSETSVPALED
jgi:hypothetical protein